MQKPFLKWVGGKTQIIGDIINKFPKDIVNYHEPFLGGGSVLLALLTLKEKGEINIKENIYAYDLNLELINVYKNIQNNKDKLLENINTIVKEYDNIDGNVINRKPENIEQAKTSKESYYYWIRNRYNKINEKIKRAEHSAEESADISIECSALFIFINKTCFRGMYRVGPNGYNIPYGHYKKTPEVITKKQIYKISNLIKDVVFIQGDFRNSVKNIKKGDFVYLDPPYVPEKKSSFVGYNYNDFKDKEHLELFDILDSFDKNNIKFVMSNSKTNLVLEIKKYNVQEITTRRAINSKNPGSTTKELIIYN